MTERLQIYRCDVCGNTIQVLSSGVGELVCCGKSMILQDIQYSKTGENNIHTPILHSNEADNYVEVLAHPMKDEHFIEFIEVYKKDNSELLIKFFEPEQEPKFMFNKSKTSELEVFDYCNIHGLWGRNNG